MKDTFTVEVCGDVATTPDYWDCQCKENYITLKEQDKCNICGATAEDSPDSRVLEVLAMLGAVS